MATLPIDRLNLLGSLKCLVKPLQELASQLPTHFFDVGSPALGSAVTEEAVVGMWTRESTHNYENNAHVTEVSVVVLEWWTVCGWKRDGERHVSRCNCTTIVYRFFKASRNLSRFLIHVCVYFCLA